jgi:hypothetical protein
MLREEVRKDLMETSRMKKGNTDEAKVAAGLMITEK